MADAELYRSKAEVEKWRLLDPITQLQNKLLAAGSITASEIERIQSDVEAIVNEAARFAEESAPPPLDSLMRDVYKEPADA
jgi:TPP-dependent pyruvate/acetoin dehydrogenase alpha subunit